ncbi:hypothetical protein C5C66_03690 [Rathayibacter toxicus]|uniref:Uncharacterized protein n=1 Tax=Rathayibacter toxicus TaxID=145458 RepID=A0A0C5BDK9_9MICO|nr:hypothetical protein [Rathayibacter toxicus]AJM77326.1 hypothetical protein TI83_03855 [Rathayibacter toxicus]ALS56800.1 hypothetical protein APU90_02615 [Rathayibacter toxicus]KKM46353.1 hypothetical protein VT73_04880 [Rathayibacter toxicus]PPG23339.1 hypothetical protein C5D15_03655 [Rathayibacter toxicus]PPG47923.1 hypothetical protein C5D16_03655 [Rathayibacter toxicus]
MNDSFPRNQHRITIDDGWTIEVPGKNGVERRTLVKGAAWSVPIIATAGATPAFAASPQPTLAFTQSSYSGTACGTITGVQVKRTADGTAPDPGKTISVTLADGYTFADGSTTYSGTTDANGLITLPDIKVPAKGGNSNFNASSDSLAASAPVSSTSKTAIRQYQSNAFNDYGNITGATSIEEPYDNSSAGSPFVLTSDGTLYTRDGTQVATGVVDYSSYLNGVTTGVYYIDSSGAVKQYQGGTTTSIRTISKASKIEVPYDNGSAGSPFILTSDGTLYTSAGTQVATGVVDFSSYLNGGTTGVYYIDSSGVVKQYQGGTTTTYSTISKASKIEVPYDNGSAGSPFILTSDGTLYTRDGTEVATGVVDYSSYFNGTTTGVYYINSSGAVKQYQGGTTTSVSTITNASKIEVSYDKGSAGTPFILTSDGTLYNSDGTVVKDTTTNQTATNVVDFSTYYNNGTNGLYFIQTATC